MRKVWAENKSYDFCLPYVKAAIRMSYRTIKVTGLSKVDPSVPTIFVGNHCTTLMDPLLILYACPFHVCFGSRVDIFRKKAIAEILNWLKMFPLGRGRDGRDAVESNLKVFDEIVEAVANGTPFCIFPEGTHHADTKIYPFKKGAARIARLTAEHTSGPVNIVPFGLKFSSFFDFMADVTVDFGEPIKVTAESDLVEVTGQCYEAVSKLASYEEVPEKTSQTSLLAKILLAPVLAVCALGSFPLLIAEAIILHGLKDKAWSNTVRFGVSLFFFLLWPFHSLFHLIKNKCFKI